MTSPDAGPFKPDKFEPDRFDANRVEELYLQYADDLLAFLTGVLRNQDLAAEALQATFIKAMESGHTANQDTIRGWMYKVALNEALGLRRKRKSRDRTLDRLQKLRDTTEHILPEQLVFKAEQVDQVKHALEQLPPEQLIVVRKRIYHEQTFASIAEELDLPLGTVLTRMRLALKKLATYFRTTQDP